MSHKVEEAELEELWSFGDSKQQPRWLWEARDQQTGQRGADVLGRREERAVLNLTALLAPFGMRRFDTEGWGA